MSADNKINNIVNLITKFNKAKIKCLTEYNNYLKYMLNGYIQECKIQQLIEEPTIFYYTIYINEHEIKFNISDKYLKVKNILITNL